MECHFPEKLSTHTTLKMSQLQRKISLQSVDYKEIFSVVLPGFEPRQADPETAVLPLHHKTMVVDVYLGCQNYNKFSFRQSVFEENGRNPSLNFNR